MILGTTKTVESWCFRKKDGLNRNEEIFISQLLLLVKESTDGSPSRDICTPASMQVPKPLVGLQLKSTIVLAMSCSEKFLGNQYPSTIFWYNQERKERVGNTGYYHLSKSALMILLLPHGNADPEQAYSINKKILENKATTLMRTHWNQWELSKISNPNWWSKWNWSTEKIDSAV